MKFWLAGLLFVSSLSYFAWDKFSHRSMRSQAVAGAPLQEELDGAASFAYRDHVIQPMATFKVRAKLLSTERYRFDRAAAVSPIDFALGWGPMSDDTAIGQLGIAQGHRYFSYRWSDEPPMPVEQIVRSAANMHLIPANAGIEEQLFDARPGQTVVLRGQLVNVTGQDGWRWTSSLTREDTGNGACEVFWVEEVQLEGETG